MPIIKNPLSGGVNFTPLDNALDELDNVINGAYESASVLPFTFDGNAVTGYTGSDTNVIIPTSYSLGEPEEVTVSGVLFTSEELTDLRYQLYSFDTVEFKDIESEHTKTYTDPGQLETLPDDFPDGAYLTMVHFQESMEALDLGQIFERFDKFPIVCNGMQLQNYTSYEEYVNPLSGIISLTFSGTITIQTYITGNDYVVTSIGDNAFENFTNLTSIRIPNTITSIGDYAFSGCRSLESITIPEGVTSIGDYAFSGCTSLTSIKIPNSVTSIGISAFSGCSGLTSITIPSSVTSIGISAFYQCSGLTSITVLRTTPAIIEYGVFNSTNNAPIYVPSQSVSTYKSATNWSSYASRIQAISN